MKTIKVNWIQACPKLAVLAFILAILGGCTPMMAQCGSSGGQDDGYYQSCSVGSNGGEVGAFGLAYQDCDCASLYATASTDVYSLYIYAFGEGSSSYGAESDFGMACFFPTVLNPSGSYSSTGGGWSYDVVAGCNSGSD